jgi:aerobic C4-dicarboxylate transport protein
LLRRPRPTGNALSWCCDLVFGVVNIIVLLAPIGAFGAMAFTLGRFGVHTSLPLLAS